MYTVTVKTDGMKTVQCKRNNDLLSFQLHLVIDFGLTQRKLAHGPVKFPARSISHFAMNIIMAKHWLNHQSKFRQMTYFQQSAKISGHTVFVRPVYQASLRKEIQPSGFSGSTSAAERTTGTMRRKQRKLPTLLEGEALAIWLELTEAEKANYQDSKGKLIA